MANMHNRWTKRDLILLHPLATLHCYNFKPIINFLLQDCPEAVHQLMLDCWQKDRKNRPKLAAVRNTLDRLMASPELLRIIAKPSNPAAFDPEMPGLTSQMTVSEWLQAIKMDRYTESFSQKGIHSMEQVGDQGFPSSVASGSVSSKIAIR